jgi:site-specific DNA recombinase
VPKRRLKTPSQTAIGYVRVSTNEQALQGLSPAAQANDIKRYCQQRRLALLPELARDLGVSGSRSLERRPYGRRVVALARDGVVGHIVATKLDRLFRDADDCLRLVKAWTRKGVTLHVINFGGDAFNSTSTMGKFFLTVMAAIAEMERGLTADRIRDVLRRKRERGEWLGATPYGWKQTPDGKHVVVDAVQQRVIRWILQVLEAKYSFREIVDHLNTHGVPPPRGKVWHLTTVKRIARAAEERRRKTNGKEK